MKYCDYLTKGKVLNAEIHFCALHDYDLQVINNPATCSEEYHHNCYVNKQTERKQKLDKLNAL